MSSEKDRFEAYVHREFEKERRVVLNGSKFFVVGTLTSALDLGLFNYLHFGSLRVGLLWAKAASTLISSVISYAMDRKWAFQNRKQLALVKDFFLFLLLNGMGLCIQLACLAVARYGLNLQSVLAVNVAQLVGATFAMLFRYFTYRRWVFPPAQGQG